MHQRICSTGVADRLLLLWYLIVITKGLVDVMMVLLSFHFGFQVAKTRLLGMKKFDGVFLSQHSTLQLSF
jgi:hypothetical protein